jgi:Zn-dependent protease
MSSGLPEQKAQDKICVTRNWHVRCLSRYGVKVTLGRMSNRTNRTAPTIDSLLAGSQRRCYVLNLPAFQSSMNYPTSSLVCGIHHTTFPRTLPEHVPGHIMDSSITSDERKIFPQMRPHIRQGVVLSVNLGRIMGIPVRIHYTLWLVFLLIAWSLATGYMPLQYPNLPSATYWAIGITSAIILFASVLVHELMHSYIAKKNGLPIARITLFFFGGVSEMTQEPQDAALEARMAAAGPLMSFLVGGVLGALWYATYLARLPVAVYATLQYGALINVILGAFNLLPAFPLDGGRVLRGSLWNRSKDLVRATRTATRVSEALSMLMMIGGFVAVIFGDFLDGIWIVFLGWFIRSGAETSLRQTLVDETLSGVTVEHIMTRDVLTVPPSITIQQLVSDYFLVHRHEGYPVVKDG